MTGCPHRDDAGAWVLGALGEPDATAFAAHLERCPECRDEVAELQGVAGVLPMAALDAVPPPELKARIMAVVEAEAPLRVPGPGAGRAPRTHERRRRPLDWLRRLRPVPAAVLATALLAIGVVAGVLLSGGGDGTTSHPGFGPRGTHVALQVSGDRGTLDLAHMPAPPSGRVYQVWLVSGGGRPRPTHTLFTVPADGRARVQIMESLKGADQVLVSAEPPRGSARPTSAPLAGAKLS